MATSTSFCRVQRGQNSLGDVVKLKASYPDAQSLNDDFIRLPQDRSHGALHVGVAAQQRVSGYGWEWRMALTTVKPSPGFEQF